MTSHLPYMWSRARAMDRCARVAALGLSVLLSVTAVAAQKEEPPNTPEKPHLGGPRILESQPFVGRFDEVEYENFGTYDYPRQVGVTSNLRNL